MSMTTERKLELFRTFKFKTPAPKVTPRYWKEIDWVSYIDKHGVWLDK